MFVEIGPGTRPALEQYSRPGKWILIEPSEETARETDEYLFPRLRPLVAEISGLGYEKKLPLIPKATITEVVMVNTFGQWIAPRRLFAHLHDSTLHKKEREILVPECHRILIPEGLVTVVETDTPEDQGIIISLFTEGNLFVLSRQVTDVSEYTGKESECQYLLQFTKAPSQTQGFIPTSPVTEAGSGQH